MAVPIAYPFIEVSITPPAPPVAERAPGVIAIVGITPAGPDGGVTAANTPVEIDTLDDAVTHFAATNANGTVKTNALYDSIELAFLQNPRPSKIYGVRVSGTDYAGALASLEGVTDVTFVSLANETTVGDPTAAPPTGLHALKLHVENMSGQGLSRIGVAMVDPTRAKSPTYVADVVTALTAPHTLVSSISRMVMIAARGSDGDMATAAMAAIAGLAPQSSVVLKPVVGVDIPHEQRYSPSEIIGLSNANLIPIIHPALITGDSLNFGEGRLFTSNASLLFIDLVRVIDDVNFKLQAGLIGAIGDARITKAGLTLLQTQFHAILDQIVAAEEIDEYDVDIPILDILQTPESTWTAAQNQQVVDARANRLLDCFVTIVYGPAVSCLQISLVVKF
jgi:hypothetical protein